MTLRFSLKSGISDPESAWSLLTDTDWMGRLVGTSSVSEMRTEPGAPSYPRIVGAFNGPMGMAMRFTEMDTSWVSGRHFRKERSFESVLERSLYEVVLHPETDGVRATVKVELDPSSRLVRMALSRRMRGLRAVWGAVLDELPAPGGPLPKRLARQMPPVMGVALEQWEKQVGEGAVTRAVMSYLIYARPVELTEIRPLALARRWALPTDEVLHAFLLGVTLGTFELTWVLRCPFCCGSAAAFDDLDGAGGSGSCESCRREFESDPDETLEAVFSPHPSLRVLAADRFCTRFPAAAPSVHAVQVLGPRETREVRVPLSVGSWRLTAGTASEPILLQVSENSSSESISWHPGIEAQPLSIRAGEVLLQLKNTHDHHERVLVLNDDVGQDRVTISKLAVFPTFRRRFGHVGLGPDIQLKASRVALVWIGLPGSVALYEHAGDGAGLAYVQAHHELIRGVLDTYRGALVKSVGDRTLCAFPSADQAMGFALILMDRYEAWSAQTDGPTPAMRIGIAEGPSLMMRSDSSPLDYFGSTLNLAHHAESRGEPGDVSWTQAVQDARGVQKRLSKFGVAPRRSEERIDGLEAPVAFYCAPLGGGQPSSPA